MNRLMQDCLGEPWLTYLDTEPSQAAVKRMAEETDRQKAYPMAPGNELVYLDDSTPESAVREDFPAPHGLNFYSWLPKAPPGDPRLIFYIHGGGFMRGNGPWCRRNAVTLLLATGLPVYAAEYRYTPEHKYPSGLDDCEWAWNRITEESGIEAKNILLTGESAGGTYILALCARLRRQGRPLPGGILAISPYLDMTLESPSYKENLGVDPTFTMDLGPTVPFYLDDLGLIRNPEVSPIFSDFTGYPPSLFCVDDTEIFLSDSLRAAKAMAQLGVRAEAYVTHGLIHCFAFETPDIPESQAFFRKVREFFSIGQRAG